MVTCTHCRRVNPPEASFCYFDGVPLQTSSSTQAPRTTDGLASSSPRFDLTPRRVWLKDLHQADRRREHIVLRSLDGAELVGQVRVTQGYDWLWFGEENGPRRECVDIHTTGTQTISFRIDPSRLEVPGSYLAKLEVRTHAGTLEVPVQVDLVATKIAEQSGIWDGVRSLKELAERMQAHTKEAIELLQGDVLAPWFAENGWPFPSPTYPARGMGRVQQFFEALRLSRTPDVLFQPDDNAPHIQPGVATELAYECIYPDVVHGAVRIGTDDPKWVYAHATSDAMWLTLDREDVVGPRGAIIHFQIDSSLLDGGMTHRATIDILTNGDRRLTLGVHAEVRRANEPFTRRLLRPFRSV